jgi:hypothetical protein
MCRRCTVAVRSTPHSETLRLTKTTKRCSRLQSESSQESCPGSNADAASLESRRVGVSALLMLAAGWTGRIFLRSAVNGTRGGTVFSPGLYVFLPLRYCCFCTSIFCLSLRPTGEIQTLAALVSVAVASCGTARVR